MAPHSSTLAWKIPWTEEPGRLQSMGSLRVGHNWATSLSLSCTGEGNGNPLQCSCLENPRDGGAWRAAVYGVSQSRTRLKRFSSSSSKNTLERKCGTHKLIHWPICMRAPEPLKSFLKKQNKKCLDTKRSPLPLCSDSIALEKEEWGW